MKKFGIVLLSLGLIAAFGMSAYAVTPEMTGQYYARGSFMSNPSMLDQDKGAERGSFSFYDQRLRVFMRFKIADGLTLTTRMDALETVWGRDQANNTNVLGASASDNRGINEQSFSFEQSWVTFATGVGKFDVGYKSGTPYGWGTKFMNAPGTAPGIKWSNTYGGLTVLADLNKAGKGDWDTTGPGPNLKQSDVDNDYYDLGASYKFQGGEAGLLWTYFRNADKRTATGGTLTENHVFQPYVKTKVGPVTLEAEAYYMNGETKSEAGNSAADIDIDTKGLYVNGKFNMGAAYVGGFFLYASGDDPTTPSKKEGTMNSTFKYAQDTDIWGQISPAILFGDDYHDYVTTQGDSTSKDPANKMDNMWMLQLYGGVTVAKKLELSAKFSYMKAVEDGKATGWQSKDYGKELDLKATYKIYDQLSYNMGAAYLWTGDWFKGTNASAPTANIYYLSHWIDLNF